MARSKSPIILIVSPATPQASLIQQMLNGGTGLFGYPWKAEVRDPGKVTPEELQEAKRVIGLVPLDTTGDNVEVWDFPSSVDDASVQARVNQLIAQLLGGGGEPPPEPVPVPGAKPTATQRPTVKVGRETKGRKGKGVTIISEVPLEADGLRELAATLKQRCGTGGTVEDGCILIQGDQRERVTTELEKLGYRVKRVGG